MITPLDTVQVAMKDMPSMDAPVYLSAGKLSTLVWSRTTKDFVYNACLVILFPTAVVSTTKAMQTASTFLSARLQSMLLTAPFAQMAFTRNQEYATKFLLIAPLTTLQMANASLARLATSLLAPPASSQPWASTPSVFPTQESTAPLAKLATTSKITFAAPSTHSA